MDTFQAMRCRGHFHYRGHDGVSGLGRPISVLGGFDVFEILVNGNAFPAAAAFVSARAKLGAGGVDCGLRHWNILS
jgi:hypothetical protein